MTDTSRTVSNLVTNLFQDGQAAGSITPTKTYANAKGENCREYTQKIVVGGKSESAFGTACRRSDGSWEIVK